VRGTAESHLKALFPRAVGWSDVQKLRADDPDTVNLKMAEALYEHVRVRYQVRYEQEPPNDDCAWQTIRLPSQILSERRGTCIDLALLFAACLHRCGLDSVVLLLSNNKASHALTGCWRERTQAVGPVVEDEKAVRKWVPEEDLIVVDPVGVSQLQDAPSGWAFREAVRAGKSWVRQGQLRYALDLCHAREEGYPAIPVAQPLSFDAGAEQVLSQAEEEAWAARSKFLGARHLFLALLRLEGGSMRTLI
jgi:hypothetical protein